MGAVWSFRSPWTGTAPPQNHCFSEQGDRLGRSVGPCKKYGFLNLFTRILGAPGAPGAPGASRRPPGPKTNQSKKPRNLKELTEQWSRGRTGISFGENSASTIE